MPEASNLEQNISAKQKPVLQKAASSSGGVYWIPDDLSSDHCQSQMFILRKYLPRNISQIMHEIPLYDLGATLNTVCTATILSETRIVLEHAHFRDCGTDRQVQGLKHKST